MAALVSVERGHGTCAVWVLTALLLEQLLLLIPACCLTMALEQEMKRVVTITIPAANISMSNAETPSTRGHECRLVGELGRPPEWRCPAIPDSSKLSSL